MGNYIRYLTTLEPYILTIKLPHNQTHPCKISKIPANPTCIIISISSVYQKIIINKFLAYVIIILLVYCLIAQDRINIGRNEINPDQLSSAAIFSKQYRSLVFKNVVKIAHVDFKIFRFREFFPAIPCMFIIKNRKVFTSNFHPKKKNMNTNS